MRLIRPKSSAPVTSPCWDTDAPPAAVLPADTLLASCLSVGPGLFGAFPYAAARPSVLLLCVQQGTSTGPRILTFLSQPSFLREMLLLSLAPGSCCGLATGQALAVTPEWPDFCGIQHPRRLLVTGDRFHGSQTPQGAGPQPQQTEGLWVGPESLSLARAGPGGLSSPLPSPLGSLQSTSSRGRGPEKLPRRQTRVAQAHSQAPG